MTLQQLKLIGKQLGYRFETKPDGTEVVYRPDGAVAIVATPTKPKANS